MITISEPYDVDAAGDDHLGAATGEEQVAVVVEVTEVAKGEEVAPVGGLGLGVVAVVHEAVAGG